MKMKHKVLSTAVASALALGALAPAAHATEVSAEIGAASMYYWRGFDLGGGAAVWGDLSVSASGFYAGIWTSSGDKALGTEYDLYVGYGTEIGDFGIDVSYATYVYPEVEISPGDVAELILGLSYGPAFLSYHYGLEDLEDYWYAMVGVNVGDFTLAYGQHEFEYSHVDVTYNYNDNLSFTLGLVVDDVDGEFNNDPKFVVSFSLPIEF